MTNIFLIIYSLLGPLNETQCQSTNARKPSTECTPAGKWTKIENRDKCELIAIC